MCRFLAFKSIFASQVHQSLIEAPTSLKRLAGQHSDGWGISYYEDGFPHVIKSTKSALENEVFSNLSQVVRSSLVLAHIRKSTQGKKSTVNTHPFQYKNWSFCHNGHLVDYKEKHKDWRNLLAPNLQERILGSTDSEWIFMYLMGHIEDHQPQSLKELAMVLIHAIDYLTQNISGPLDIRDEPDLSCNYLNFSITDGEKLLCYMGGQSLYYSTSKKDCPQKNNCPYLNVSCHVPQESGQKVNHLLVASTPSIEHNQWTEMRPGQMVGIDENMNFHLIDGPTHFFHKSSTPLNTEKENLIKNKKELSWK